jgi:hypothetical protein
MRKSQVLIKHTPQQPKESWKVLLSFEGFAMTAADKEIPVKNHKMKTHLFCSTLSDSPLYVGL